LFFDFLFKFSPAKYLSASVGGLGKTIELVFVGWAYDGGKFIISYFVYLSCGGEACLGEVDH